MLDCFQYFSSLAASSADLSLQISYEMHSSFAKKVMRSGATRDIVCASFQNRRRSQLSSLLFINRRRLGTCPCTGSNNHNDKNSFYANRRRSQLSSLLFINRRRLGTYPRTGSNNHNDKNSSYAKYLEPWSLRQLVSIHELLKEDEATNDSRVAELILDVMKRLEINSDRITFLQQKVEIFHSRLRNVLSNKIFKRRKEKDDEAENNNKCTIQDMMHVLEDQRKILRNLQRLHYDTWDSVQHQHMGWSSDDETPTTLVLDAKQRLMRWSLLVQTATEIGARHSLTTEQMSELVIALKPLERKTSTSSGNVGDVNPLFDNYNSGDDDYEDFNSDLNDVYETVCAFMRCRMTQQLLCQHLVEVGQDVLGASVKKEIKEKQKQKRAATEEAITAVVSDSTSNSSIVGAVNINSSVASLVRASITEASRLCEATYLVSPRVEFVIGIDDTKEDNENNSDDDITPGGIHESVTATFVRAWLRYTLIELLKNAMAATVETNPDIANALTYVDSFDEDDLDDDDGTQQQHLPSLYFHIFETDDNVVIKLYDQGKGLADDFDLESLFRFAQRKTKWDRLHEQQTYAQMRSPLKGLGVGLSLSRWHMQHFGGDLTLERNSETAIQVQGDSGPHSKWHVLGKGMTATIYIPKNDDIPLAIS